MSTTTPVIDPPKEWSKEVIDLYEPVRPLGKGGFGSVFLAKSIDPNASTPSHVAIKVVGAPLNEKRAPRDRRAEKGYFHREELVLKEISHPNIMRVLDVMQDDAKSASEIKTCAPYCMILSYHKGPTLEQILEKGGALGLPMAKEVSRQLLGAISFLHGHAIIHRDIKPDNIIITGASLKSDECWSDDEDAKAAVESNKWKLTLIDFGFARPLHPEDMKKSIKDKHAKEPTDENFRFMSVNDPMSLDGDELSRSGSSLNTSRRGRGRQETKSDPLDQSLSHVRIRSLSAVGNKHFAAPEILKRLRNVIFKNDLSASGSSNVGNGKHEPLAECVSDYSMVVDSYSAGATIRFMLTGVPPSTSVEDFLATKNHPAMKLARGLGKIGGKIKGGKKVGSTKRKKKYRSNEDLPNDAKRLVLGLTHWDEKKRTTIREALAYEWISNTKDEEDEGVKESKKLVSKHGDKLEFLHCALEGAV